MRTLILLARGSLVALLAVASTHALGAQGTAVPGSGIGRNVLAINPLGIPFEYFSAEYEGAVGGSFTLGANASYFSPSDETYASFELKGRLYPNEEGPKGFAVGLGLGVSHLSEKVWCFDCGSPERTSTTRPTVHVFVDYNWLLGPSQRFFVGTGVGAKRVFGLGDDYFRDIGAVYPTARFQIGVRY